MCRPDKSWIARCQGMNDLFVAGLYAMTVTGQLSADIEQAVLSRSIDALCLKSF